MTEWIAKTKSCRTYESTSSGVQVSGYRYFHQPTMRSFHVSMIPELTHEDGRIDWTKINSLPLVDRPIEGEHFYIATHGDAGWRISTPIVSVEDA